MMIFLHLRILIRSLKHLSDIKSANGDDQELIGKMLLIANQIATEKGLAEDGFRYVINTGKNGGQTVYHLHLHIIGGRSLSWPPG